MTGVQGQAGNARFLVPLCISFARDWNGFIFAALLKHVGCDQLVVYRNFQFL
jgi:hypothetical protein